MHSSLPDSVFVGTKYPAMNRWAIFGCPSGTQSYGRLFNHGKLVYYNSVNWGSDVANSNTTTRYKLHDLLAGRSAAVAAGWGGFIQWARGVENDGKKPSPGHRARLSRKKV
ncbi:MAG: hypothetical protein JW829_01215 [Pirellulales bacterium]|nr:hypothetical protein [Pirellulales bacterium]